MNDPKTNDRYRALDAFLDRAFAHTPNTMEANEIKLDISANLRQQYDELLASGMSEEAALAATCDSLGDPAELFGDSAAFAASHTENNAGREREAAGGVAQSGQKAAGNGAATFPAREKSAADSAPSFSERSNREAARRSLITAGVLLCALCWMPTAILAVLGASGGWIAAPLFLAAACGVFCFVYSAALRCADVAGARRRYGFIGLGVACEVACVMPVLFLSGGVGVAMMFVLIAVGVVLIVTGGMHRLSDQNSQNHGQPPADSTEKQDKKPKKPTFVRSRVLWLSAVGIYLLLSFLTGAWHVTWLVFPLAAVVAVGLDAWRDLRAQDNDKR